MLLLKTVGTTWTWVLLGAIQPNRDSLLLTGFASLPREPPCPRGTGRSVLGFHVSLGRRLEPNLLPAILAFHTATAARSAG